MGIQTIDFSSVETVIYNGNSDIHELSLNGSVVWNKVLYEGLFTGSSTVLTGVGAIVHGYETSGNQLRLTGVRGIGVPGAWLVMNIDGQWGSAVSRSVSGFYLGEHSIEVSGNAVRAAMHNLGAGIPTAGLWSYYTIGSGWDTTSLVYYGGYGTTIRMLWEVSGGDFRFHEGGTGLVESSTICPYINMI